MKKIIALVLYVCIIFCFARCNHKLSQVSVSNNPDSVKKTIIALNDECYRAYPNPEKVQAFFEDSLLVAGPDQFMTSSYAVSHDLGSISVLPHNYTFKLFGNTAVLSYLLSAYEIIDGDTIYHNTRDLKTFVFSNGKWKVACFSVAPQTKNYFKPVVETNQRCYASYAGVYKVNAGVFDTIFVKNGKLYDRQTGDSTTHWNFPVNDNEYMNESNLDRVVFGKDSKGVVAYYTDRLFDGQEIKCLKIK